MAMPRIWLLTTLILAQLALARNDCDKIKIGDLVV